MHFKLNNTQIIILLTKCTFDHQLNVSTSTEIHIVIYNIPPKQIVAVNATLNT